LANSVAIGELQSALPSRPRSEDQPREARVLRFDRVSVQFENRQVLENISFEVRAKETIVLLGAAASGKTVLLKTAIGLIQPDEGDVYLFDQDIARLKEETLLPLRRRVGVLFQENALFDSLTVAENVAFPLVNRAEPPLEESEVDARVKEKINFVELSGASEKYPSEISGGMQRRVGIARAVVTEPTLMLYDSPTAGLDPITAFRIVALLIRQRDMRNQTSLVITHRLQDGHLLANWSYDAESMKLKRRAGSQMTRFLVLRKGRLVFEGSEQELRSSTDPYVSNFAPRFA
jgi:phospholipid/cholesterol/gamma-HCH transport system ATP-binding protein